MILLDFKREMREYVTDRKWGGHHTRRDTSVDVRLLVGRMGREQLFQHFPGRGADDEDVKEVKDWVFKGQVVLEEGVHWKSFSKSSLRESDLEDGDDEDEEAEYILVS
jgi:hypothetical protein